MPGGSDGTFGNDGSAAEDTSAPSLVGIAHMLAAKPPFVPTLAASFPSAPVAVATFFSGPPRGDTALAG